MRVNAYTVEGEAVRALPEKVARRHAAFPLTKVGHHAHHRRGVSPHHLIRSTISGLPPAAKSERSSRSKTRSRPRWIATTPATGIPHQLEQQTEEVIGGFAGVRSAKSGQGGSAAGAIRAPRDRRRQEADEVDEATERSAVVTVDRLLARAARRRCQRRASRSDPGHLPRPLPRGRHVPRHRDVCPDAWRPRLSRASRCCPAWTSPSIACRRTADSASLSASGGSILRSLHVTRPCTVKSRCCACSICSALRLQLEAMGMRGTAARSLPRAHPPARGDGLDHGPDGQRQDLDALRRAGGDCRDRQAHHHHRRSGRGPVAGRQPGPDQRKGRLHVRARPSRHPATGPRRHHDRRDSRSA